ncbi:MAG TPA: Z1 domain-containing protein [Ginsengibacter sp.]|nr:Z1 domain-containing protein [Ginsengibacter sp.]
MSSNKFQAEKNFTSSLITALSLLDYTPTREQVEEKARQLSNVFGYDGPLDSPVEEALAAVDTRMGIGVSLVDIEAKHDEEWVLKRQDIAWTYSAAYEKFLKSEKWHPTLVQSLSDVATKILGHLQDPESEGSWDRRGLVIGHVQSGKTANYLGLISKAADSGYKFIIVIAGIHNNLRKQTQERIDIGFVGRSSDPHAREIIGVGCKGYPYPATLTNIYNDFNKQTADQSGWSINDFSKPIVLVIKKNVSTLTSLHRWLKELNAEGDGKISDVPMLMIDDEADNASINTNKPDLDPTRTNAMIRQILSLFAKSCYVGYTATPFANIFINPDAYDDQAREELFPRDFIYCLDAPNSYFGPDKVFLDDQFSEKILQSITDAEDYIPLTHKKDHEIADLPPSLYRAVVQFVIVRAIRNLRGQKNKHCSMMINVSRFVSIQNTVRTFISTYEKKLKEAVKANYAMPEHVSAKNEYMALLEKVFREDFDCEFEWADVKATLHEALESLRTFVVNSKSDEVLDYKKYEKDGTGLTAIAIGGLSLSRGLTIEGLTISYMYRNTRMYDTLMQMGRWFGYRLGYEDLCRVHLSQDSIDWYSHIAESADDLREQIKQMRRDGLSPKKFGLYVKAHPDSLLITATNKMRSGERITVKQNFSGKLLESYILPVDEEINSANRQLIAEQWKVGFGKGQGSIVPTEKGWFIKDVEIEAIEDFLLAFRAHPEFVERRSAAVNYLKSISDIYRHADVLLISVKGNDEQPNKGQLGFQIRESAEKKGNLWRLSKDRVASRGDEKIGLTEAQKEAAISLAKESDKNPSDFHYRSIRNKPLLMLHSLKLGDKESLQENVPAFGISFPTGDYSEGVEVVANTVWVNQIHGDSNDLPDEEEDFDE